MHYVCMIFFIYLPIYSWRAFGSANYHVHPYGSLLRLMYTNRVYLVVESRLSFITFAKNRGIEKYCTKYYTE